MHSKLNMGILLLAAFGCASGNPANAQALVVSSEGGHLLALAQQRGGDAFEITTLLDQIIQPITTQSVTLDGRKEMNYGNGFVVGRRFFTVNHNLNGPVHAAKMTFIDEIPISPRYKDAETDIAVFDLPEVLCNRYCNDLEIDEEAPLRNGQKVFWLRKFRGAFALKHGRILNYTFFGNLADNGEPLGPEGCAANVVVEVDTPFLKGSSGSPVVDAEGRILGIIQGSFTQGTRTTGYFKPIQCVPTALPVLSPSSPAQ